MKLKLISVLKDGGSAAPSSIYIAISPRAIIALNECVGRERDIAIAEAREADYQRFKERLIKGAWSW